MGKGKYVLECHRLREPLRIGSGTLDCVNKAIDTLTLVVENGGKDTGEGVARVAAHTDSA